jgi:hypothetical protein
MRASTATSLRSRQDSEARSAALRNEYLEAQLTSSVKECSELRLQAEDLINDINNIMSGYDAIKDSSTPTISTTSHRAELLQLLEEHGLEANSPPTQPQHEPLPRHISESNSSSSGNGAVAYFSRRRDNSREQTIDVDSMYTDPCELLERVRMYKEQLAYEESLTNVPVEEEPDGRLSTTLSNAMESVHSMFMK